MNSPQVHMIILPPSVSQQQPRRQNQNQKHVVFCAPLLLLLIPCWARSRGASAERRRADKCLPSPAPHQATRLLIITGPTACIVKKDQPGWPGSSINQPNSQAAAARVIKCVWYECRQWNMPRHTLNHIYAIYSSREVFTGNRGENGRRKKQKCVILQVNPLQVMTPNQFD